MGVSTDMSGRMYGMIEAAHWYENMLLYGVVALFFIYDSIWCVPFTVVGLAVVFFLEILIDNVCARVKWDVMIKTAWSVILVAGGINLLILQYLT